MKIEAGAMTGKLPIVDKSSPSEKGQQPDPQVNPFNLQYYDTRLLKKH